MPVSHSSSASLSSFSFSHLSHTSSSSSSPDSVFSSSQGPAPLSTVPFLWEEKPGVLKKDMEVMVEGEEFLQGAASARGYGKFLVSSHLLSEVGLPYSKSAISFQGSCSSKKLMQESMKADSSKKLSRTFPAPAIRSDGRSELVLAGERLPRLRPPPCLMAIQPPHEHAYFQNNGDARIRYRGGGCHRHETSTATPSLSLLKGRHQRRPSLEDDPFWVAMVACTNEATPSDDDIAGRHSSLKDSAKEGLSRSNSWLLRKGREGEISISLHFEQCLPRGRALTKKFTREKRGLHSTVSKDDTCIVSNKLSMATIASTPRVSAKAFKALSLAKASLQDRCKMLLHQPSDPQLLDISSSSTSRGTAYILKKKKKKKLPIIDLFGCKSDLLVCDHPIVPVPSS